MMSLTKLAMSVYTVCLILGIGSVIYLAGHHAGKKTVFFSTVPLSEKVQADSNRSELSQNSLSQQMRDRLKLKNQTCSRLKYDGYLQQIIGRSKNYQPFVWFIPKYNMSFCFPGKTGNTFIKHLFTGFVLGDKIPPNLESGSRGKMHATTWKFMVKFETSAWRRSRLTIPVRNPYTRLYSAYIDRVSIPMTTGSVLTGDNCKFNVSFSDFLERILDNMERGKLNVHWSPIYLIFRLCDTKPTYIIKQESLIDDIKFVLNSLNLSAETCKALNRRLQEPRINWTITGIVKDTFKGASKSVMKAGCIDWLGVMRRLWGAFQIQGYIDEHLDMPLHLYNKTGDLPKADLFVKKILNVITEHPLTKEMKKDQRRRAVVNAYKHINKQIIQRIKLLYKPDFDMFGYSEEPPS